MRSGNININSGHLSDIGIRGYNWSTLLSSRFYSGSAIPSAYYYTFGVSRVGPSDGSDVRWTAFPLRWLLIITSLSLLYTSCAVGM